MVYKFFQAEDGIRDVERSRGLGDVYKRQVFVFFKYKVAKTSASFSSVTSLGASPLRLLCGVEL